MTEGEVIGHGVLLFKVDFPSLTRKAFQGTNPLDIRTWPET